MEPTAPGGLGDADADLIDSFVSDLIAAVAADTGLSTAQRRRCRAVGQQAARRGVALRVVLQLYLAAARRSWPELVTGPAAADPARAGQALLAALDDAVGALTEGFQLARRGIVREEVATRREFVDDLLTGSADVGDLVARANHFGLDLAGPHAVAALVTERALSDSSPLRATLERAVQGSKGDADVLVASKDGALVVVFAAPDRAAVAQVSDAITALLRPIRPEGPVDLRRRAPAHWWLLGLGRPVTGPTGIRRSYAEAREVLDTARRLGLPGPILDAADMLVYRVLLRDRPAIVELVDTMLGPLRTARLGPLPLLETLQTYFDCGGNAVQAARRLHLSPRALTYRLERVARLTGHDPADPQQRFALHAAVLGARLLGWPGPVANTAEHRQ